MARAMTVGELANIRKDGQFSKMYLAIHTPETVFACQVNQTFDTTDKVADVYWDNGTFGAYTDVLPGMTCYVGSAPGLYDLGMVRVRKPFTVTIAKFGENSDIPWADNLYLTVVDEMGLWAKHPRTIGVGDTMMDYDVDYTDQHTAFAPVPVMGGPAVLWLLGADVSIQFDGSNSWCLSAGAKSYLWTTTGGSVSGGTTATPTFTYTTTGVKRVACTVTVGGISYTGYRYVFVYSHSNMPVTDFSLGSCNGSFDDGGWEFEVTMYGSSANGIRDRAMVILFAEDFYGTTKTSIGPEPGRENLVAVGWINSENMVWDPDNSTVTFTVMGPHFWLKQLAAFIEGVESTPNTVTDWTQMNALTVDKAVWHLFTWRSTVSAVIDYYRTEDTNQTLELYFGAGNLWAQVSQNLDTIFGKVCCDRTGRLYTFIEIQMVPVGSRSSFPVVLNLETIDWRDSVSLVREIVSKVSQIQLSGVFYADSQEAVAYFSLATGHVFKRYGDPETVERVILASQTDANQKAGRLLAWRNVPFNFEINISGNNRMVDICPRQYFSITIPSSATPRGIGYSGNVVPRTIRLNFDNQKGTSSITWSGEQEVLVSENYVDGDIPLVPGDLSTPPENYTNFTDLYLPPLPNLYVSPVDNSQTQPTTVIVATDDLGILYTRDFDSPSPTWFYMNTGLTLFEYTRVRRMEILGNGNIVIMVNSDLVGNDYLIYWAPLGGVWTRVPGYTDADANAFRYFRVDSSRDNALSISASDGTTAGVKMWVGSTDGVSAKPVLGGTYINNNVDLLYNGSIIYLFYSRDIVGRLYKLTNSGSLISITTNPPPYNAVLGADANMRNYSDVLYVWTGTITRITNNGAVWFNTLFDTLTLTNRFINSYSCSPDGNTIIACQRGTLRSYISNDRGVTWDLLTGTIPVGNEIWENCGDGNRWLFGSGIKIALTMDKGATYLNKQGNMPYIAALCNMTIIKYIK